jgi:hypothetical protein
MGTFTGAGPAGGIDIFISHNRQQKEWVRGLVELLRNGGMSVFFDEDSIPPGGNFIRAIGNGLDGCRFALLVLSRSAVRSRWVAMETAIAVVSDPAATDGRLIPILIEALENREFPPELRIRNIVDLSDTTTRDANLRRLLEYLGLESASGCVLPAWPTSTLRVVDVSEVRRWGWTGEDLVKALVHLDADLFGQATVPIDQLVERWTPMFTMHPETWRVMIDAPGSIVGYWHFVSLFDDDLALAKLGELAYSDLTSDRLRLLELPGHYDMYFSGIGIESRYRTPYAFKLLFDSLLGVLLSLAQHGVFFESVWANGYTPDGISLCRSLELQPGSEHRRRGKIFSAAFAEILQRPIAQLQPDLVSLYEAANRGPRR